MMVWAFLATFYAAIVLCLLIGTYNRVRALQLYVYTQPINPRDTEESIEKAGGMPFVAGWTPAPRVLRQGQEAGI